MSPTGIRNIQSQEPLISSLVCCFNPARTYAEPAIKGRPTHSGLFTQQLSLNGSEHVSTSAPYLLPSNVTRLILPIQDLTDLLDLQSIGSLNFRELRQGALGRPCLEHCW